ncbi:M23 family metallopeptidase [Coraliomargarita parva]|uniref:M23 family metallopeptidase n=1 Tax=Coraliomargarita parva TaxID=3014050 RepID=UPI0022B47F49|nr:M23 family metallopeptidase [Coraliomargarita parva]
MRSFLTSSLLLAISCGMLNAAGLTWPTPNPAFQQGLPIDTYVQPTVSGRPESGLFGCVRNDGARFHEGIDLKPLKRDSRGEPTDAVYAILPGRIAYVNKVAGRSSYGRYIVIVHDGERPAFHSLYAHLASVASGIDAGARVDAGTVLGVMGRSASYSIPKNRAHVHLELGLRLTDHFQQWYDRQKFGSLNYFGYWNGMNLVGVDPLDFYQLVRLGKVRNFAEYLKQQPAAARIRVYASAVPDFVRIYPDLLSRDYAGQQLVAWDIAFTQYGVPKEWTPRFASESLDGRAGDVRLLAYNKDMLEQQSCRRVVDLRGGGDPQLSKGTIKTLQKLFGFR